MTRLLKLALMAALLAAGARASRIEWNEESTPFLVADGANLSSLPPGYDATAGTAASSFDLDDPEPPVVVLVGLGLVGLGLVARRASLRSR